MHEQKWESVNDNIKRPAKHRPFINEVEEMSSNPVYPRPAKKPMKKGGKTK